MAVGAADKNDELGTGAMGPVVKVNKAIQAYIG